MSISLRIHHILGARHSWPQDPNTNPVLGFHRDMFAEFPQEGIYHRPGDRLLFNALSYFAQDLDDEIGPLRIIPGSHMKAPESL